MCKLIWLIKVYEKRTKRWNPHHCNSPKITLDSFNGIGTAQSIIEQRHGTVNKDILCVCVCSHVDGVAWPKTEIRITVTKLLLAHTQTQASTFAMIVQILFKIARLHRHYIYNI